MAKPKLSVGLPALALTWSRSHAGSRNSATKCDRLGQIPRRVDPDDDQGGSITGQGLIERGSLFRDRSRGKSSQAEAARDRGEIRARPGHTFLRKLPRFLLDRDQRE